jgi:hypothetical protein
VDFGISSLVFLLKELKCIRIEREVEGSKYSAESVQTLMSDCESSKVDGAEDNSQNT